LHRFGRLSRAELARIIGLNRSSSGNIIAELTAAGFVREVQEEPSKLSGQLRAGRPGILLELSPEAAFFLGAEIGVEHITTVEIDLAANIVRSTIEPFDGRSVPVEEAISRAVEQAFRDIAQHKLSLCEGFGLSAPAQMDGNGHASIAPILGWRDVDLNELARAALPVDVPVLAENDANAFAIGATYSQLEARSGVTMFLVIESGVGGGIAIDGKLFRGGRGLAGEVGHLKVPDREERNLEQAIGLRQILTKYRSSSGREEGGLGEFLRDVHDRVPAAIVIAEDWAQTLAFAIVQVSRLIDPDRIVLGGSLAELYPLVAARVAAHIKELQAPTFPIPEIVLNESAAYGSAFGAACMMHQRFLSLDNGRFAEDPASSEGIAAS
jgi:predicted NBD/HSP70 family sugar kinase